MTGPAENAIGSRLRLGAIGSLGALTLLWLARMEPVLFPVGTVLLTVSMVPLATGFRARGGLLLGLLFGVLWVAAKLEFMGSTELTAFAIPANAIAVAAIVSLGLISGLCFGLPDRLDADGVRAFDGNADRKTGPDGIVSPVLRDDARQMLHRFRDWMTERDPHGAPWVSFDNLVREVLRDMTGARRVRCYRLNVAGELTPLNGANPAEGRTATIENPLIGHVLVTGRRFCARSSTSGAMIEELADGSDVPYAWVVPIRSRRRTCGLITAEEFDKTSVGEARLELAADLIEEFWCHLQKAEGLRLACAIDRPSGVLNRVEILGILDQTVEQCYANHEPVVMLALAVEGIRTMDDGGQWDARNHVVEAIGKTMQERLRRDDVIGRFSDDRFIVVLRRLDVALAHLIAHKILGAAEQALQTQFPDARLRLRVGLAGSGFEQVPPQKLLLDAFDAITEARQQNLSILPASKEVAAIAETA